MGELSIEQKAKAYDRALKVLHKYDGANIMFSQSLKEEMFPELRESDDERIRKELINFFSDSPDSDTFRGIPPSKVIAWLKKQGEQNPTDKIEPKFKVGDEIKTANEESLTITKIDEKGYWSNDLFICGFDDAAKWELVEQKPAEWNEEDETMITDLSVIVHTYFSEISGIPFKYDLSEDKIRIWLDSLKDRVQPKQEWNEEDEKKRNLLIDILNVNHPNGYFKVNPANTLNMEAIYTEELVDWLKFLKDRYTWKPSDEQIKGIECAIKTLQHQLNVRDKRLNSLYDDLKKLKGNSYDRI